MKNELDELLKHVLTPNEEAGDILNRKILEQVKETEIMRERKGRRVSAAVIVAALVAGASITAVAAWQYKSAPEIADRLGDDKLAGHFAEQMTSVDKTDKNIELHDIVGESQNYGGYQVTVLGLMSGEDLSKSSNVLNGSIRRDRTYCAVAIQKEDGTAVDAEKEDFFVSPLIGGLNPAHYNAASMGGSYGEFVEEGILYRLVECENITYFADHELYLSVSDTAFYDNSLYHYDETAGSISRNTDYAGLNALFKLELDASLADPVKAQALLDELEALRTEDKTEIERPKETEEAMEWASQLTPENLEQFCVRMENSVQTLTVDQNGFYVLQPWLVNEEVSDTRGGGGGKYNAKYMREYSLGMHIEGYNTSGGMEDLVITTFTMNEDGTLTFAAWVPKEGSDYLK